MVAYSFQPCFVIPIRVGLRLTENLKLCPDGDFPTRPKLQTIRAIGKRRHARPSEALQLYCRQRSPQGFKIGDARCIGGAPIIMAPPRDWVIVGPGDFAVGAVRPHPLDRIWRAADLDRFAQSDGFADWAALRAFWREHHGVIDFTGRITFWEPEHEASDS